ncbi:MAG: ImmA/IrrE family metallo-endopeptidase [Altererythrobacter sp.]|nr:ImmA/IrrE family metallo-endopeptidase [Altererythrobacter sp.]
MSAGEISNARRTGERAAREVLQRWPKTAMPVPIKELATLNGCQVRSTILEDDLSGMAFIKEGAKFIVYNAAHHPNRQRFTIAHELGHHVMHQSMLKKSVHVDKGVLRRDNISAGGFDKVEISANAFAACVLMPEDLMRSVCPDSLDLEDDGLIANLSKLFGVSAAAFTNRVLNLSL